MAIMKNKKFSSVNKFANSGSEKAKQLIATMEDYAMHDCRDNADSISAVQFSGIVDKSKSEKALKINEIFMEELQRRSGVSLESYNGDIEEYAQNPNVVAMEQYLKKVMVEAVKPITVNASGLALIAEIRYAEYGGVEEFVMESMKGFDVSEIGDRQKHTDSQRRVKTSKSVPMKQYGLTTITSLPEIWKGEAMVADDVMLMAKSITDKIYRLALAKFNASTLDTVVASKYVAGSWSDKTWIKKLQMINVENGKKPIIVGSAVALRDLLPSTTSLRVLLTDEYNGATGFMADFLGYKVIAFDPVSDSTATDGVLGLPDNRLLGMSADAKPIKVVIGKALTNGDGEWDNNDLSIRTTLRQEIGVDIVTCEKVAVCKLS